jgi:CHASE3 domain sensor protein
MYGQKILRTLLFGLFLLLFAVGVSMAFASNIMVREERRKEKQEQMYPH